uniref:Cop number control protein n=1 Tax=Candidatus Phytoplasma tritici TaxID=321961 RepID=K7W964_9MOLU|nr:DUF2963 domain-containing protein [Candidatus Phytoplasma tritici]AFW98270.1 cop number control protein [Candidatus Phytoplasma tritici]
MKTNNQTKPKNKIFIIWGLFITGAILIFLIFLLLAINKSQSNVDNQNQPNLNSKTNSQQEQETYNKLMNKIEKEINDLTSKSKVVSYHSDGITPSAQEIYDQTGNKIKYIMLDSDGKSIQCIKEYNPQTGNKIKETYYNHDGTVKKVKNFK